MVSPPTFLSLFTNEFHVRALCIPASPLAGIGAQTQTTQSLFGVAGMYGSTHSIQTSTTFRSNYYIVAKRLFLARKR